MRNSGNFRKRGEVWLVNFNPGRGSEQRGIRPAVVIQNDIGNEYSSTTIIAAVSTKIKSYPVTVLISDEETGLDERSLVNLSQLLTIDKTRLMKRLGRLGPRQVKEVDEAVKISLGLA